jgi:hypothetical protein
LHHAQLATSPVERSPDRNIGSTAGTGGAQTAAAGCFDPPTPLTVEEQRLTASLPAGGQA